MYKILLISFFMFSILMVHFPGLIFGNNVDVAIIEKKIDFTKSDLELSTIEVNNLHERNKNYEKKEFEENRGTVIINSKSYLCKLDQKSFELRCTNYYLCKENYCNTNTSFSDMYVQGNRPSFSTTLQLNSDHGLHFSKIKFYSGEFEIIPHNNYRLTDMCKKINADTFPFDSFSVGNFVSHSPKSIICVNMGDECYGIIAEGETKFCEITNVIINDYNKS